MVLTYAVWSVADGAMYYSSKRRGEDGIAAIIDFLLSNARLVLGVGGVAVLGIATLAVKKVHCCIGIMLIVARLMTLLIRQVLLSSVTHSAESAVCPLPHILVYDFASRALFCHHWLFYFNQNTRLGVTLEHFQAR